MNGVNAWNDAQLGGKHRDGRFHRRRRRHRERRRRLVARQAGRRRRARCTDQPGARRNSTDGSLVISMKQTSVWSPRDAAVLFPFAVGCNSILGIKDHALDPDAGGGGGAGTGGGSRCTVDGAVTDADGAGTSCGFIMPNALDAPGDLPNRASYTRNPAARTVTDNVTGLTWEAEVDPTTVYPQADAIMHCQAKPGGGWRLPTRIELVSLVDFTIAKPGPTISTAGVQERSGVDGAPSYQWHYRKFWTSSHAAFSDGYRMEIISQTAAQSETRQRLLQIALCVGHALPLSADTLSGTA